MSLLNWLGLLWLLVVPALILLYMFRPRRLRKQVPSLRLWNGIPQLERTHSRLRRPPLSLLLLLELIALAAGAFALAQPALTVPAPRNTVIILDASGSMQALANGKSRFNEATNEALKIINAAADLDRLTLLRAGANVTTACSACNRSDAVLALATMSVGAGEADIAGALAVATGVARHAGGSANAVVISDGQYPPVGLSSDAVDYSLRFVQVGSPVDDVAVVALAARRPPDGRSGYVAYARIDNRGSSDVTIQVQAEADNVPLPARSEAVPSGANVGLTWQVPAGTARFTVSANPGTGPADALYADNSAVIFLPVSGEYAVNLLSSQPDVYLRALASIDGLRAVTNTIVPGVAFSIIEGKLPDPLPDGPLLLVEPDGNFMKRTGTITNAPTSVVDAGHPLLAGLDLNALTVSDAGKYDVPAWAATQVDSPQGPLVLAGEQGGRRVIVLTFSPQRSNLPKLAAFPLLMANAVDWLYPFAGTQAVAPGQPVPLAPGSTVQTPSGHRIVVTSPGLFTETDENGVYRVTGAAGTAAWQFAVNMADKPDCGYGAGDCGAKNASGIAHPELSHQAAIPAGEVTSQVFWLPLAVLALALFSGEWLVYCWKRGST